jgi:hypothetical protein
MEVGHVGTGCASSLSPLGIRIPAPSFNLMSGRLDPVRFKPMCTAPAIFWYFSEVIEIPDNQHPVCFNTKSGPRRRDSGKRVISTTIFPQGQVGGICCVITYLKHVLWLHFSSHWVPSSHYLSGPSLASRTRT